MLLFFFGGGGMKLTIVIIESKKFKTFTCTYMYIRYSNLLDCAPLKRMFLTPVAFICINYFPFMPSLILFQRKVLKKSWMK